MLNFCAIFTKARIYGLSLDFSEAKYGRIYDQEWLMMNTHLSDNYNGI